MSAPFIHPSALVETDDIGEGARIWAFTHVMAGVQIGPNCNIGEHCFIESGVTVGADTTVKNGNMIWEGVSLGKGVFVGPNVLFTNDLYPRSPRLPYVHDRYASKDRWLVKTTVGDGASIGAGAVILPGAAIGEFATVAAGAVVTKDVPAHNLVRGNPARIAGFVCRCGRPFASATENIARCEECGYQLDLAGAKQNNESQLS